MNLKKHIKKLLKEQFLKEDIKNLTLYHASNKLFNKFELKRGYRTHLFSVELTDSYAIFLTPDINAAKLFGENYLYICKINPKRILDWRNGLDLRTYEWIKNKIGNIIPYSISEYWMLLDDKLVIDYLNKRGIDCIIIDEIGKHDHFDTYAVLNPDLIKIQEIIDLKKNQKII